MRIFFNTFFCVFFLFLCLCVNSWARCTTYTNVRASGGYYTCNGNYTALFGVGCENNCHVGTCGGGEFTWGTNYRVGAHCTWSGDPCSWRLDFHVCDTEEERDSLECEIHPEAENCTRDTLIYACSESIQNGRTISTIYRLSCKQSGGNVTSCNGKQVVDIPTDGEPVKQMEGTCAENGLPVGPFGGQSPQDSIPKPANAECFAITGSTCHMRDKLSGNTFTCECDGNCNYAINQLLSGNGCHNPYPQPQNDSLNLGSSDSGQGGNSSDSGQGGNSSDSGQGGNNSSSSGEGGGGSPPPEDFEYDYTYVLEAIRANTQYTGNQVSNLNYKVDISNDYLQQIANKNWSPIINVNGDTAKAPSEILGLLQEGGPNSGDTAGLGGQIDGIMGKLDSIVGEGVPDMSDSVGNAVRGIHTSFNAFKDTLGNSSFNDSLNRWNGLLTNNGVITGNGSNSCPSILTQQFTWSFPLGGSSVNIQVGTLGKYICTPISPFNVTIWQFCRVILRAMVSIGCMIWLYKAVLGIEGVSNEED